MSESIFSQRFLVHLFHGHVRDGRNARQTKPRPRASGFHYEGAAGAAALLGARVKDDTRSNKDRRGVYTAVAVISRGGLVGRKHSAFFPAEWSRLQVLEAIREVYMMRPAWHSGRTWEGRSKTGVYIHLHLNGAGQITTAFPKREYRRPALRRQDARRRERRRELLRSASLVVHGGKELLQC